MKKTKRKIKEIINSSYPENDNSFSKIEKKVDWNQYSVEKKKNHKGLAISLSSFILAAGFSFLIVFLACPELFSSPVKSDTMISTSASDIFSYGSALYNKLSLGNFLYLSNSGISGDLHFSENDSILIDDKKPSIIDNNTIEVNDKKNGLHCYIQFRIDSLKDFTYQLNNINQNKYFIQISNQSKTYQGILSPSIINNNQIIFQIKNEDDQINTEIIFNKNI